MKRQVSNLFFLVICASALAQKGEGKFINVKSVDFSIFTSFAITCDRFEVQFKDRIVQKLINQEDAIRQFEKYIQKSKFVRKNRQIDVRATFLYEKGKSNKIKVCSNLHEISIDGKLIKYDKKFADFLVSLTKQ